MGFVFAKPLPPRPAVSSRVVIITGCDTGFGYLTALRLDQLGYQVVALCLTEKGVGELQAKGSSRMVVRQLDVTQPKDITRVTAELEQRYPRGIYGLVNNAGVGHGGPVEWTPMETFKFVMDVNFFGTVAMVKALGPLLRRGYGRIINIASVAGFAAAPSMAAYAASKHAIEAFTDSLRVEMAPFGVAVTAIEPFFMRTPIIENASNQMNKLYNAMPPELQDVWGSSFVKQFESSAHLIHRVAGNPNDVVDTIVHALQSSWPRTRYTPAPLVIRLTRFTPTWLSDFVQTQIVRVLPAQSYTWLSK